MITFRQKEFIAPLIAALAPAVIQGGAGIIQGKKANESQERIARQQQVQAIKDRKAQEQQALYYPISAYRDQALLTFYWKRTAQNYAVGCCP